MLHIWLEEKKREEGEDEETDGEDEDRCRCYGKVAEMMRCGQRSGYKTEECGHREPSHSSIRLRVTSNYLNIRGLLTQKRKRITRS